MKPTLADEAKYRGSLRRFIAGGDHEAKLGDSDSKA